MATADEYAAWIVKNADKKGTPEFATVASAYQDARGGQSTAAQPPAKEVGFGESLGNLIKDVPRQVGLTARYGIEGVGNSLDFLASPIRGALNLVTPKQQTLSGLVTGAPAQDAFQPGAGETIANALGLPKPQTATERVVGDATRMMAGTAVPIGLASKVAQSGTGAAKVIGSQIAAGPGSQIASSGASGAADAYTKETGGGDAARGVASLVAGIAAPMAINKAQNTVEAVQRASQRLTNPASSQSIDIQINNALDKNGIKLGDLAPNVQQGIRADVSKALQTGGDLSPDAVRRLADYHLIGAKPTAATLSLDPAMVSQQKNLAKIGINSKDKAAQELGQTENANNRLLIQTLNDTGANTAASPRAGGQTIMNALTDRNDAAKSAIGARYDTARAANGRSASLDPSAFTKTANASLDDALLGGKLPGDVRNLLNNAATGKMPLTVDTAEQFKTRIGDLQRSSTDPAERKALGLVRSALDDTPLLPGQEIGQEAQTAFDRARKLNRTWMNVVDQTPALQAVRDGIEPDKFVQQFVVGNGNKANVADIQALQRSIKNSPEALAAARNQIAAHLKGQALNGAADEVGNFSQSAYNKALKQIGDDKLALFFSPEEVTKLKAAGRVASYEQFQPKGSAVNNSNTAGAGLSAILDRIGNSPLLSKIPFGNALSQPIANISVGMQANKLLDASNSLKLPANKLAQSRIPFLPIGAISGLGQND